MTGGANVVSDGATRKLGAGGGRLDRLGVVEELMGGRGGARARDCYEWDLDDCQRTASKGGLGLYTRYSRQRGFVL